MALKIEIIEEVDATGFKLYDLTTWGGGFNFVLLTAAEVSIEYQGDTYTYDIISELGLDASFVNVCGDALNSYFTVTPDKLLNGSTPLNTTYFPDGYYEITLNITYNGSADSDVSNQGFLAESYVMASKLPLLIDPNNFDYEENRLQFLCIAMLRAATWAAELGKEPEFTILTDKVNDFLDARGINEIWST
jgi:hypothetical protein